MKEAQTEVLATPRDPWLWIAMATVIAALVFGVLWLPRWERARTPQPAKRSERVLDERPEWRSLVDTTLATGRVDAPPILAELREGGAREDAPPLAPIRTVVESDRPRFTWPPVDGATSYRIDVSTDGSTVALSEPLTDTSWQPSVPFPRGRAYEWRVVATTKTGEVSMPKPTAPHALFAVLSTSAEDEIESARSARPDDKLLLGLLYARAGVVERAEEELRNYAASVPQSAIAARLHRAVAGWLE
ncbi:MAG: hypothetical protein JOZ54_09755 [Acidobacteria bacterium]|nr:hypothetical protein [Acidobacteriota bacterium]